MQANNNDTLSFTETLDRWVERREREREQMTTTEEQLAAIRQDNALLSEVLAEVKALVASIENPTTNNH